MTLPRTVVDQGGVEWEIYDESEWSIPLALDWSIQAQAESPGLIFVSVIDRRRLWPAPEGWQQMNDAGLLELLQSAKSIS